MDLSRLAIALISQAHFQGEFSKEGDEDYKKAAALAAQQTLHGIANAIQEVLREEAER